MDIKFPGRLAVTVAARPSAGFRSDFYQPRIKLI